MSSIRKQPHTGGMGLIVYRPLLGTPIQAKALSFGNCPAAND
jgi:hypothetical protein